MRNECLRLFGVTQTAYLQIARKEKYEQFAKESVDLVSGGLYTVFIVSLIVANVSLNMCLSS